MSAERKQELQGLDDSFLPCLVGAFKLGHHRFLWKILKDSWISCKISCLKSVFTQKEVFLFEWETVLKTQDRNNSLRLTILLLLSTSGFFLWQKSVNFARRRRSSTNETLGRWKVVISFFGSEYSAWFIDTCFVTFPVDCAKPLFFSLDAGLITTPTRHETTFRQSQTLTLTQTDETTLGPRDIGPNAGECCYRAEISTAHDGQPW